MAQKHNNGSGSWTDPNTWFPTGVPGSGTDVLLDDAGPATVSLTGTGNALSLVIANQNTLALTNGNISSGRINVTAGGTLLSAGGTNSSSTITNQGGSVSVSGGSSLNAFGYNTDGNGGSLNVADNATLEIGGTIKNSGDITLSGAGNPTKLLLNGSTTFTTNLTVTSPDYDFQGGNVTLSDSASNIVTPTAAGATLTTVNNVIGGAGKLGDGKINIETKAAVGDGTHTGDHAQGVIKATGVNNKLLIDLGSTRTLRNGGLLESASKAGFDIAGTFNNNAKVWNSGTIQVDANSKMDLENLNIDNTGGTIAVNGPNGSLELGLLQINGGTLTSTAGSFIGVDVSLFTNMTLNLGGKLFNHLGNMTTKNTVINLMDGGQSQAAGAITFDKQFNIKGGVFNSFGDLLGASSGEVNVGNGAELGGFGEVNVRLFNVDTGGKVTSAPKIQADIYNIFGSVNGATLKGGDLHANATSTISNSKFVNGIHVISSGVVDSSSFGVSRITFNQITANGAGKQTVFAGTDVTANVLSSSNGGVVRFDNSTTATTLEVTTIAPGTSFVVDNGAQVEFDNFSTTPKTLDNVTFTVGGTNQITVLDFKSSFSDVPFNLTGGSQILLSDSAANRLTLDGAQLALVDGTISGAGQIGETAQPFSDPHLAIGAGGTIVANDKNKLSIQLASVRNDGVLKADGGRLEVVTTSGMTGGGTVLSTNGGTVDLSKVASFGGALQYFGKGTIVGPLAVPPGTISGFATGDSYVFGQLSNFTDPLTASWQENAGNTGGTLTIKSSPTVTFATLQLAGLYDTTDFTATQLALSDGKHVAVNFTGPLRWLAPVTGNWNQAAKWGPTGLFAPGASDDALITATGAQYAVNVTQNTTVRTVATGDGATLDIEAGVLTITDGTKSQANAGTVKVEAGASLVIGGTFQQTGNGKVQAVTGGTVDFAPDAKISGGRVVVSTGATLNAKSGDDVLDNVVLRDDGKVSILKGASLALSGGSVVGQGSFDVADGATLALANANLGAGNTIDLVGKLQVNSSSTLNAKVAMADGSAIVGGVSPATLTNGGGAITGFGKIGSDTLKLVNQGTITTRIGGAGKLTIDTGDNAVDNAGTISALAGGQIVVNSILNNTSKFNASGGSARFNSLVNNDGGMSANGAGSNLSFMLMLASTGKVMATGGGTIVVGGEVTQAGALNAVGNGSTIDLDSSLVAHANITLKTGAELTVTGGQSRVSSSNISIDSSSEISIVDSTLVLENTVLTSNNGVANIDGSKSGLGLTNTTLNGGNYGLAGTLVKVGGTGSVLNGTNFNMEHGAKFVSNGSPATLTNGGFINGAGLTIGDDNLTFVNNGTITPEPGADITFDTGNNAIVNNGSISTADTNSIVNFGSLVSNSATGKLLASAGQMVTLRVDNAGLIDASSTGHIEITGGLFNTGTVMVENGGVLDSLFTNNSGKATSTGAGSTMTLGNESNAAINSGQIVARDGGTVLFERGVNNLSGGQLAANAGGTVKVIGAATGGIARLVGQGAVMDFEGDATATTTTNAGFAGVDDGQLVLNNSARYAGTVAGLEHGDSIDVKDVAFVAGKSSYDAGTGLLSVSDGTHTTKIQLLGQYQAGDFGFASDNHGGTLVTDIAPAAATIATFLTTPA
jgi:hypothetical protein